MLIEKGKDKVLPSVIAVGPAMNESPVLLHNIFLCKEVREMGCIMSGPSQQQHTTAFLVYQQNRCETSTKDNTTQHNTTKHNTTQRNKLYQVDAQVEVVPRNQIVGLEENVSHGESPVYFPLKKYLWC